MNSDLRRSKRHDDFIAVNVLAQNGVNGDREAGPFSGRIINISRHGACLLMSLGVLESYEVYSKTYRNDSSYLEIQGSFPTEMGEFKLAARPIWTDPFIIDDMRAFKMGVDFIVNPIGEQMNTIIDAVVAR